MFESELRSICLLPIRHIDLERPFGTLSKGLSLMSAASDHLSQVGRDDFAHGIARECVDEDRGLRMLVACELVVEGLVDLFFFKGMSCYDNGDGHLAPFGVRPADNRYVGDGWVRAQDAFEFGGVDVLAA